MFENTLQFIIRNSSLFSSLIVSITGLFAFAKWLDNRIEAYEEYKEKVRIKEILRNY